MSGCKKCKLIKTSIIDDTHTVCHLLADIRDQLVLINKYTKASIQAIKDAG